jgi:hypothetical protein
MRQSRLDWEERMAAELPVLAFEPGPGRVVLDLDRLVTSRLLIQASNGGGGFNNALGRLRTVELIVGSRELRASEVFFQEAPARRARRAAQSRGQ